MSLKGINRIADHEGYIGYLGDEFYDEIAKKVGYDEVMRPDEYLVKKNQINWNINYSTVGFLASTDGGFYGYLYLKYDRNNGNIISFNMDCKGAFVSLDDLNKYVDIANKFIKLLNEKGLTLEELPDEL